MSPSAGRSTAGFVAVGLAAGSPNTPWQQMNCDDMKTINPSAATALASLVCNIIFLSRKMIGANVKSTNITPSDRGRRPADWECQRGYQLPIRAQAGLASEESKRGNGNPPRELRFMAIPPCFET